MQAPQEVLPRLAQMLKTGMYSKLNSSEPEQKLSARIMMTAEKQVPGLSNLAEVIKVSQSDQLPFLERGEFELLRIRIAQVCKMLNARSRNQ